MKVFDTSGQQLLALGVDTTVSNTLSVLSQAVSVLSASVSTLSNNVSVLSNAVSVISQNVSVLSQAVSVLSQAVSILSASVSVLSQAVSVLSQTVSAISVRMDTISNANSVNSAAISVLSQAVSALSQAVSVLSAFDVGTRLFHTTTQTISTGTVSALSFDTERWDTDAFHNLTSATQITIPAGRAGKYLVHVAVTWDASGTGIRLVGVRLNGATYHLLNEIAAVGGGGTTRHSGSVLMNLAAGDYVECVVQQTSGGPLAVQSASDYTPVFALQKL